MRILLYVIFIVMIILLLLSTQGCSKPCQDQDIVSGMNKSLSKAKTDSIADYSNYNIVILQRPADNSDDLQQVWADKISIILEFITADTMNIHSYNKQIKNIKLHSKCL